MARSCLSQYFIGSFIVPIAPDSNKPKPGPLGSGHSQAVLSLLGNASFDASGHQ